MVKKQFDVKELAAFMSKPENFQYVSAAANQTEKHKRIDELKSKFLSGNQSNFSNDNGSWVQRMGAAVEDVGNESFSFLNDTEFNFASFNQAARAEHGILTVKRIIAVSNVRDSARAYALQRNETVKKNKAKAKQREKQVADKFVSHPNFY